MIEHNTTTSRGNILVVDDTPDNLRLLIDILTREGYEVRPASDGEFALQSVHLTPPDVILLDIKMPGMDGYTVCKYLKADERTRDIPVIFISALQDVSEKVKGFEIGGVDYITKPFQTEEVLARINTHLTLRKLQQGLQEEIGKRRQAEEELRAANQHLQETNADKDKLFSIIAHDLRGPFSGLIEVTETIIEHIEDYSKDEIKEIESVLHASSKRVYALIENLLAWSRLQRGLMECDPQMFSLSEIAERSIRLFADNAAQKQITIRNRIPRAARAYADFKMIDTVFRNLLSNAVKFATSGSTIDFAIAHQDEQIIEIAVADTGIGISWERLNMLFRIDVKSSRKGTAGEEGSGLGLILCKELVEKNGGSIRVDSQVGQGTTLTITLPKQPRILHRQA